ncbi:MAG TPA: molybdate ABC transporter substrate-binding protein [Acidimicrobiales bacterium]|nr:molybdate ABC transporter substrate-binding protein [Acidimicrobiales bacterium]
MRRLLAAGAAALLAAAGTACGGSRSAGGSTGGPLVVFAAASLTEPFQALARTFQSQHPGVGVRFNFAASSALARSLREGADADVLATADEATMATAVAAGDARGPVVFVRNRPAILVAPGNPEHLAGLADLARPGVVLALCAPEVPCGALAAAAFRSAGVTPAPATLEPDVKAVVAKVVLGEADAGVVYRSDVRAAGAKASGVDVDAPGVENAYPIAVATAARHRAAARQWVDLVLSAAGRRALVAAGFQ